MSQQISVWSAFALALKKLPRQWGLFRFLGSVFSGAGRGPILLGLLLDVLLHKPPDELGRGVVVFLRQEPEAIPQPLGQSHCKFCIFWQSFHVASLVWHCQTSSSAGVHMSTSRPERPRKGRKRPAKGLQPPGLGDFAEIAQEARQGAFNASKGPLPLRGISGRVGRFWGCFWSPEGEPLWPRL